MHTSNESSEGRIKGGERREEGGGEGGALLLRKGDLGGREGEKKEEGRERKGTPMVG